MTQPRYAPITEDGEVRPAYRLAPPRPWRPHRAAELRPGAPLGGAGTGVPGPDQGYALHLANRLRGRLVLSDGEHVEDIVDGAVAVALARAALFGRAPVSSDLQFAFEAFGFFGAAPAELVAARRPAFAGAARDYAAARHLAHLLPELMLRWTPEQVSSVLLEVLDRLTAHGPAGSEEASDGPATG